MQEGKSAQQLDLLLLKAESYSKFIQDNQLRSSSLLAAQLKIADDSKEVLESNTGKRKSSSGSSGSIPKKVKSFSSSPSQSVDDEQISPVMMTQPSNLRGTLMPHQIEGLQWLLSLWENGLNGILADEMGLGKTIQIIALIAHLRSHNTAGPYLIAGPLATISNWQREFEKWLPSCPVVLYHGSKPERENLRRVKMQVSSQKSLDFPVVITSFEMCITDRKFLEKYVWQYVILDEGHRIKNRNCKLIRELKSIRSVSRLLLTGTPIQNSLEELWSLLNFCCPSIFDDLAVFQSWFGFKNIGQETKIEDILDEEERDRIVTKLHDILRPFVLRRFKKDTIGELVTGKREIVLYCGMGSLQNEYYRRVLDGTLRDFLVESGVPNAKKLSQINMQMNLRKVCNHPFLFGDLRSEESSPDLIISSSGKFKLLNRLLPRLRADGHKVIIFSQMTEVLNLLEEFLEYRGYEFVRLDGQTKLVDRQLSIDAFNEDENIFIFLISTRAGGLGINLTAADTVILFDSDWNPHVDSQAQDRCHRIGQTEDVLVYRFLTIGSVEIDIMKKQISKKKLERLTIHGGDFRRAGKRSSNNMTIEELRRLLEDDVRHMDRIEQSDSFRKEISEEELNLVLDRFLLFSEVQQLRPFPLEGAMYDVVSSNFSDGVLLNLDKKY